MAPTLPPETPTPSLVPPPVPVDTHPNRGALKPPITRTFTDPSRLAPEDVYKTYSPPRLRPLTEIHGSAAASAAAAALRPAVASLRAPPAIPPVAARLEQERKQRSASRKRRRPHVWKKLLWIKQHGYPDNYTDTETFLDHLQRNPRLRPYDFWPLVADSMVIVQHACSVAVFICAYAGIYQGRLSPVTVVTCGSIGTVVGWIMWDHWVTEEESRDAKGELAVPKLPSDGLDDGSSISSVGFPSKGNGHVVRETSSARGLGLTLSMANLSSNSVDQSNGSVSKHGQSLSKSSFQSISPIDPLSDLLSTEPFPELPPELQSASSTVDTYSSVPSFNMNTPRMQARLKTFKSALLIYFTLLGLSPIMKSLTKSTSSDSIWAIATWLIIINIFFFDYGTVDKAAEVKGRVSSTTNTTPGDLTLAPVKTTRAPPFPSSLSTNAALMASTVLASRLPTTTAVFSLTLFSIQVFGLFPVFRRYLRHQSWSGYISLTVALVAMASCGLSLILSQSYTHTYGDCHYCIGWIWHVFSRSFVGLIIGGTVTAFGMGGCSWWLIGLQRYKNVVSGPWDPAKPVLAGGLHGRARSSTD